MASAAAPVLNTASSSSMSATISNLEPASASLQLGNDGGISSAKALRQKFVKTNPEYANSFGSQAFERATSYGLKIIGWRVIDRVQNLWERLEPSLLSLLVAKRDVLYSQRPPGLIIDPPYMLRCFLVGPDKAHATPHATVLCREPWLRKAMGKLIKDTRLLVPDGFECCGLPDEPKLYGRISSDADSADDLGSSGHESSLSISQTLSPLEGFSMRSFFSGGNYGEHIFYNDTKIGQATVGGLINIHNVQFELTVRHVFRSPKPPPRFSDFQRQSQPPRDPPGLEIDLFDTDEDDDLGGKDQGADADLIGWEEDSDDDVGLTISYPEPPVASSKGFDTLDLGASLPLDPRVRFAPLNQTKNAGFGTRQPGQESEYGSARADDLDEDQAESEPESEPEFVSDVGLQPEIQLSNNSNTTPAKAGESSTQPMHRANNESRGQSSPISINSSPILVAPEPRLDWALRKMPPVFVSSAVLVLPPSTELEYAFSPTNGPTVHVYLITPSIRRRAAVESTGIMGAISISRDLRIPPQRVQVITLPQIDRIQAGDCGSWAWKGPGQVFGMLIGACPSLGEAYILSMEDILEDIHNQTRLRAVVKLPNDLSVDVSDDDSVTSETGADMDEIQARIERNKAAFSANSSLRLDLDETKARAQDQANLTTISGSQFLSTGPPPKSVEASDVFVSKGEEEWQERRKWGA